MKRPGWWPLDPFVALDLWLSSGKTHWVQMGALREGEPERYLECDRHGRVTGREANFYPEWTVPRWRRAVSWAIRPMCRREVARWHDVG